LIGGLRLRLTRPTAVRPTSKPTSGLAFLFLGQQKLTVNEHFPVPFCAMMHFGLTKQKLD
jgi:hypothetical protein